MRGTVGWLGAAPLALDGGTAMGLPPEIDLPAHCGPHGTIAHVIVPQGMSFDPVAASLEAGVPPALSSPRQLAAGRIALALAADTYACENGVLALSAR